MTDIGTLTEAYRQRFFGVAQLYGNEALMALARAHFLVIGLGGVGTWAAEALARTGVGALSLCDLDEVCTSNTNRQIHALHSRIGQAKTTVMAERLMDINPELQVEVIEDFLDRDNLAQVVEPRYHVVLDAIDTAHVKSALVAHCSALKMRLVMAGSSGGRRDPQRIGVADLGEVSGDRLLAKVRAQLYRHFNFRKSEQRKFRVDAVYSPEQMRFPRADGSVCASRQDSSGNAGLGCAGGFGSSVMVTGSFGFAMAQRAIHRYLQDTSVPR